MGSQAQEGTPTDGGEERLIGRGTNIRTERTKQSERPGLAAVDVTVADESAGDRPWTLSHCKSWNRQ